jgi:DHA3 family tetracycline resistance protein-like MFS transporter
MPLLRALRHRSFSLLLASRAISALGDFVHDVALAWLVLQLTGSAAAMGLVVSAKVIPALLVLAVGGVVADRLPKIRTLVASDAASGAVVIAIAFLVATDAVGLGHLVILNVVFGIVAAVFLPTWSAIVPELVPAEDRSSANALATLATRVAGIVGPALGAGLIALGGTAVAFGFDALTFLLSIVLLALVRRTATAREPQPEPVPEAEPAGEAPMTARASVLADLRSGFRASIDPPWIAIGIGAAGLMCITLAGPIETNVPLLIERSFGNDVRVLGWYGSAMAAGSVVAALVLGSRTRLRRRWRFVYGPWVAGSLAMATLGLPIGVPGLLLAAGVIGFGFVGLGLAWVGALQDHVPPELFGRVTSLDYLGSGSLLPVGTLVAGVAADAIGPAPVFLAGGLISAAFLASLTLLPQVRAMD